MQLQTAATLTGVFQVDANVMVVMDSFALPVEGTETRVNAQAQGYEYMTAYIESAKQVGAEGGGSGVVGFESR